MSQQLASMYAVSLLMFLLFIIAYRINPASLIAGFILSASGLIFLFTFFIQAYSGQNLFLRFILVVLFHIALFFISFGVYIFITFLVLNTRLMLKREKRGLKHCLTLILAFALTAVLSVSRFVHISAFPRTIQYIIYASYGVIIFYLLHLCQYVVSAALCNLRRPPLTQDYIIALGCWIKNGQVTPILARRLDKAIDFYNRQKEARRPPKMLLSGGKGGDETCTEAEAMKMYVLNRGIPEEDILLETESVSTYENMIFSKAILDDDADGAPYSCVFATNNYHLLRAYIYARKAGLKTCGIGAKTAFYYLPNAILREYIAYLYIYLKLNIIFGAAAITALTMGIKAFFAYVERMGFSF